MMQKSIYLSYLLGGGVGRWWAVLMYAMTLFLITEPTRHHSNNTQAPVLTASISCYVRNIGHLPPRVETWCFHGEEGTASPQGAQARFLRLILTARRDAIIIVDNSNVAVRLQTMPSENWRENCARCQFGQKCRWTWMTLRLARF